MRITNRDGKLGHYQMEWLYSNVGAFESTFQ